MEVTVQARAMTGMHSFVTPLGLVFALIVGACQQQGSSTESQATMQQRARDAYEQHKQAAIRINDLAYDIQSQSDANALVSAIATLFEKELPPVWIASGITERVAKAEYQSFRDPDKRIPEQRIADVWNQYVRDIDAPKEAIVTVPEIHNMRDAEHTVARVLWARGQQTVWAMPNIYAVGADDKVSDGCRAVETIRVIYDLYRFENLRSSRDRVRKGILVSEQVKGRAAKPETQEHGSVLLAAHTDDNPVRPAERRYLQEHSSFTYEQLLLRLFDELLPDK
jgi:hypothetical protein